MSADDVRGWHVGMVGYGEVGRILAEELRGRCLAISAHDIKLDAGGDVTVAQPLRAHAHAHGVTLAGSAAVLAAGCDLVISVVTATQALQVAEACSSMIRPRGFFLDLNSTSPGAKKLAARRVLAAGGRYVEGAVMASVPPYRSRVPLLLGGPHAQTFEPLVNALGFAARTGSAELGIVSATKMCRSVMIKGLEAMMIECLTTARHYGVETDVLASLGETFPGVGWESQASYFFQRVIEHGRRRSEEVFEVAQTVREAGLERWSADGTARRQAWVADLADAGVFGGRSEPCFARNADWRIEADRMLAQLRDADG